MLLTLIASAWAAPPPVHTGDLVFHRSRSDQSEFLRLATHSDLTHVGVVWVVDGEPMVLEAIQPVSLTPLEVWAKRAADGRIRIERLADADRVLTTEAVARMDQLGRGWLGRSYDARFGWSDDRLYCSELVYKLFAAAGRPIGTMRTLGDFDLSDPRVAEAARQRFGGAIPKAEPAISPADLAADPGLVTVCDGPTEECVGR